jgi:hypothetical protein
MSDFKKIQKKRDRKGRNKSEPSREEDKVEKVIYK